jgi:hypothetical protein
MPLTECPDCGGIVSDSALTCPTCHRVLVGVGPEGAATRILCVRWALVGATAIAIVWALVLLLS